MQFQIATNADTDDLARMNHQLIRDEGHRNRMTIDEIAQRMTQFLMSGYEAVIFLHEDLPVGYALYKREPDWVYLRQFFVIPDFRRRGLGREALDWLRSNVWRNCPRVRLDVLVGNKIGIAFWRAAGFADYCLTMEWEAASSSMD
jgi:GNAT superfamily N-acetyltransferase